MAALSDKNPTFRDVWDLIHRRIDLRATDLPLRGAGAILQSAAAFYQPPKAGPRVEPKLQEPLPWYYGE